MKRRSFFTVLANVLLVPRSFSAQAPEGFIELVYPAYPNDPRARITKPGNYYLAATHVQRKLFGGGHVGPRAGVMLEICCGSVKVDLGGKMIGADFGISGVRMSERSNVYWASKYPDEYGEASLDSRFVKLAHGKIDMARGEQTLEAISFSNEWTNPRDLVLKRPTRYVESQKAPIENIQYKRNEYLFEDLTILANDVALIVEGSHTVIRNCIIESASNAAVFIAGPNVTIENCEIYLRSANDNWYVREESTRAAIVLRDASNAVIRNNRIRVDRSGSVPCTTLCILVSDGAQNVLVENNTFINVKGDPVSLTDGAKAVVRNNEVRDAVSPS